MKYGWNTYCIFPGESKPFTPTSNSLERALKMPEKMHNYGPTVVRATRGRSSRKQKKGWS
jgi:hypothetical protein